MFDIVTLLHNASYSSLSDSGLGVVGERLVVAYQNLVLLSVHLPAVTLTHFCLQHWGGRAGLGTPESRDSSTPALWSEFQVVNRVVLKTNWQGSFQRDRCGFKGKRFECFVWKR